MSDVRVLAMEVAEILQGEPGDLATKRAICMVRLCEVEGMIERDARWLVNEVLARVVWRVQVN